MGRWFFVVVLGLAACGDEPLESGRRDAGGGVDGATPGVDASAMDAGDEADGGEPDLDAGVPEVDAFVPMDAGPAFCARLKVTVDAGLVLNIRPTPSTSMSPVGTLNRGYVVAAVDLVRGETVAGEDRWYEIESPAGDGFVHWDFVACTEDDLTTTSVGYYMPFRCGTSQLITQGPGGGTSHGGTSRYAWDFGCSLGTSIRAMRAGTVAVVWMNTEPGERCYDGGGSECADASNRILIHHPNGQTSLYKHLNSASVRVGDSVAQGQEIGRSGTTGWSTGPHLHVGVCDGHTTNHFCQTVSYRYQDIGNPGNVRVTSGNCP